MRTLVLLFSLLLGTAHAFTPESGNWWNPDEPGSGYTFEIQDDFLFATIYTYDTDGRAAWYTAQGFLDGNDFFQGNMIRFRNGQCLGCNFTPNQQVPGVSFPITIDFTSEITALMSWPGGVDSIQRLNFILGDYRDEAMRGEWQTTIDFLTDPAVEYPFFGDVLVIDTLEQVEGGPGYSGCRAEDSISAFCTTWALDNQLLVGFATAENVNSHVIIVENSPTTFLTYFVNVGTYQFDGFARVYPRGAAVSGPMYPVRGHRTASWRFVETCAVGNCSGPAGGDPKATTTTAGSKGLADALKHTTGVGLTVEEAQASRPRMDLEAMIAIEARLIQELEARIAKRAIIED